MSSPASSTRTLNYGFAAPRTWLIAAAFVAGNIILPQLCHLMPQGGLIWLPIYFFTLVGAWLYDWKAGIIIALASPLVNSLLFGMPAPGAVMAISLKSALLAVAAGYAASVRPKGSIVALLAVVLAYQAVGCTAEWLMSGSLTSAVQDFRLGVPGMLLQIFGGFAAIRILLRIKGE